MSQVQTVRALVNQRLTAAAEEIFGLFERTIAEYEEELCRSKEKNERQQKLLDAVLKPEIRLHRADVQQQLVVKEEVPPEQQEWSPSLDQEDPPEPPHIKEEQEELWTSQEGEQLQGLEEAVVNKFLSTPVPVKSEDDEEKPQSSQLHQRQTEQKEKGADGEDCGGPEPARISQPDLQTNIEYEIEDLHPDPHLQALIQDSSETEDSDDYSKETSEPQSGLKSPKTDEICKSDMREAEPHASSSIEQMETGADGEDCGGPEPARNSHPEPELGTVDEDGMGYSHRPFSCSVCSETFCFRKHLKKHMKTHPDGKPFSCSVCAKRFTHQVTLTRHMCIHTGEKRLSCSVCDQGFIWRYQLKQHKCLHPQSSQLHQTQTEQMETGADGEDCGGPEPARNSQPDPELGPVTEDNDEYSNISKETKQPQSGLKSLKKYDISKSDMREAEPPASSSTEQMETGADGEDCGGPEPARNSHPDPESGPKTEVHGEPREPHSSLTYQKNNGASESGVKYKNGKPFRCSACGKVFTRKGFLTQHMAIHTAEKRFTCSICDQGFTWAQQFKKHTRVCHQSSQLHQNQTEQMETGADGEDCGGPEPARNSHQDPELGPETDESDDDCKKTGEPQSDLKSLKVPKCDKGYNTNENHFSCCVCGKIFSRRAALKNHMKTHPKEKSFACSDCGKRFCINGTLKIHMRIHMRKKPFCCSVCRKRFTQKAHMTAHMVTHTGEKLFRCRLCEQSFTWYTQLKRHKCRPSKLQRKQTEENREAEPGASSSTEQMETGADGEDCGGPEPARNSHPDTHLQHETEDRRETLKTNSAVNLVNNNECDTIVKPFRCLECCKPFRKISNLKAHLRIHSGEKPFACSLCGQRFTQKIHLTRHMTIHTGEKPFKCSICGKRFNLTGSLTRHMSVHT